MKRPLLLDLFCGAGGAAMGYHRAGFEVVGVDIAPQPNYPFRFIQADALDYLLAERRATSPTPIHAIHASPPCQAYTAYRRRGAAVGAAAPQYIEELRTRLSLWHHRVPWVIENVIGAPLRDAVQFCGSSFRLDVRRHRIFESNFDLAAPSCDHGWQLPRFPAATNRAPNSRRTVEVGTWRIPLTVQRAAMGIDWMTLAELSQAVPPAYTKYIGAQLLDLLGRAVAG